MHKKIIGILVCMLLIISVYAVSATNKRMQENNIIEEVNNKGESDFLLIVYVHHRLYLRSYPLHSNQMFICRVGNSGLSTEPSLPFTLSIDVYTLKGEHKKNIYTNDFGPIPVGEEIDEVVTWWHNVEPEGLYYLEAEAKFEDADYEPVYDVWYCDVLHIENSAVMPLTTILTLNIPENNFQNNLKILKQSSGSQQTINLLFLKFLVQFPILQRLLQRLELE